MNNVLIHRRIYAWLIAISFMLISPLSIAAFGAPNLSYNPDRVEFGAVEVGECRMSSIRISNEGDEPLNIDRIEASGEGYSVTFEQRRGGGGDDHGAHFQWNECDNVHSLLILSSLLNGSPLSAGCDVAVFTPAGFCCGGVRIETAGDTIGVAAHGDDPNIHGTQGFEENEEMSFCYWDWRSQQEINANAEWIEGSNRFQTNGFSVLGLSGEEGEGPDFVVDPGAGFFANVTFSPEAEAEYNGELTIDSNDPDQGEVRIVLAGVGVRHQQGDPWIRVHPDGIDFREVLAGGSGAAWLTIENVGDADLIVESIQSDHECFRSDFIGAVRHEEAQFSFRHTDANHSILVLSANIDGEPLAEGSQVGVFTEMDLCAGASLVEQVGEELGVAAWENDPETEEVDGFEAGETIYYRFWDVASHFELEAEAEIVQGSGFFGPNGVTVVRLSADSNQAEGIIAPGDTLRTSVLFTPVEGVAYSGTLTVTSNDTVNGVLSIQLHGVGYQVSPPEVVNPIADQNIQEDADEVQVCMLDDVFRSPLNMLLEYSWMGSNSLGIEIRRGDREESYLYLHPAANFNGRDLPVQITATDETGESAQTTFLVNVIAVNDPPVWSELPEQRRFEIQEGDGLEFVIQAIDTVDDNPEITYFRTGLNGIENARLVEREGGGAEFIMWADYGEAGDYHPVFIASDGEAQVEVEMEIVILHTDRPPRIVGPIDGFTVNEDCGRTPVADLDTVVVDVDGDQIMFNLVEPPQVLGLELDRRTNILTLQPANNWFGEEQVTIAAIEANGRLEYEFTVTVNPVNDAPVIIAPARCEVNEGDSIEFFVRGVDVEDDSTQLVLSLFNRDGLPDAAQFINEEGNGTGLFHWQTDYNDAGGYQPVFRVRDREDATDDFRVTIIVHEFNPPPQIQHGIRDIVLDEDAGRVAIADLDTVFIAPDNEALTLGFTAPNPLGFSILNSHVLQCRPDTNYNSAQGELVIVTAQDSIGQTASDTFRVTIRPVNDHPNPFTLIAPEDRMTVDTANYAVEFRWQAATDVENDTLRYLLFFWLRWKGNDMTIKVPAGGATSLTVQLDSLLRNAGIHTWREPLTVNPIWWAGAADREDTTISNTRHLTIPVPTSVDGGQTPPLAYKLAPVFPNPLNSAGRIDYSLPSVGWVRISVYDRQGREIARLAEGMIPAGEHSVVWNAGNVPAGVYFVRLDTAERRFYQKVVVVR